jgi:hypothetical protein
MSWFTLFIVADIVIMAAVMFYLLRRRMLTVQLQATRAAKPGLLSIDGIRALTEFANAQHERIGNYLQANWSGAPEQLPSVLGKLIATLEEEARAKGIPADRDLLTSVVEASLRAHRIAKGHDVREALKKAA